MEQLTLTREEILQRINKMNEVKRPILNLLATIGGVQYVLGILRFNLKEFSYFFTYPNGFPESQENLDSGEKTSPLDHITCHDGRIHIKRKDNVAIEILDYPGLLLADPPRLTPIFIESFYFNDSPCCLSLNDFTPWKGSVSKEILTLESSNGFSLILLLTPSTLLTPQILMGLQFADIPEGLSHAPVLNQIIDQGHEVGRVQAWNGWDLLIIATPFKQSTITPIPSYSCRLPNYKNVPAALTDLLCQANGIPKVRK